MRSFSLSPFFRLDISHIFLCLRSFFRYFIHGNGFPDLDFVLLHIFVIILSTDKPTQFEHEFSSCTNANLSKYPNCIQDYSGLASFFLVLFIIIERGFLCPSQWRVRVCLPNGWSTVTIHLILNKRNIEKVWYRNKHFFRMNFNIVFPMEDSFFPLIANCVLCTWLVI